MNTKIRTAVMDDLAVLTALAFRSKAYWGYPREFMDACREELRVSESDLLDPSSSMVVAEAENQVTGFCQLRNKIDDHCILETLYVDPDWIGQRIGSKLLEFAAQSAQKQRVRYLEITSDPHAVGFYQNAGAVLVAEKPSGSIAGRLLPVLHLYLTD